MLKRVLIILHLCLAFSILLYLIGFPFLGAHFSLRSDLLVVESALGKSTLLQKIDPAKADLSLQSLSYKRDYLKELNEIDRKSLLDAEALIHEQMGYSAGERLGTLQRFFASIPLSLWAWIFLSVFFSVKMLKELPLPPLRIWILPLLAFIYCIENYERGRLSPLESLIPPEPTLALKVEGRNDHESWLQNEQSKVKEAWSRFLLSQYGKSEDHPAAKREALAEMRFQMAWIKKMNPNRFILLQERHALLTLLLFLFWNLYFAFKTSRSGQQVEKNTEDVTGSSA